MSQSSYKSLTSSLNSLLERKKAQGITAKIMLTGGKSAEKVYKLLYVEDNPANLRLVEHIFIGHNNIELISAPEAKLGIELACHHKPTLILMDINLPGMDGLTAFKYLKANEETRNIPVIAVTANASQTDINQATKG